MFTQNFLPGPSFAVLWIASFILSGYFGDLFAGATPTFTILGFHPSFAPTIFLYWIGGTAMFGPVAVGLSSMAGIASAFALVGVPGIIYTSGNAMTFWMLSGAAFAMSYIILGKKVRAMAEIAPISSLGDICDVRFNNNHFIKAIMSIIICLGCVGYLAAQISAGSSLIAQLVDIPPLWRDS